ncbi:hypothetical protein R8N28_22650 [Vibrio sp. Vb1554]|uniref:serine O-acetyltransferase n=1 Tax=unclassified Vibrio TaxID=2614977 RepID=UPI000E552FF6|nr:MULTISPECIES: serine acetyltransferase [unclassified Vibrio]AXT69683.1 serine acetyltransferase [Vibrio sp. dhg]MDW3048536.1 hypothetical protein [Vibrio sp. Vb1554]
MLKFKSAISLIIFKPPHEIVKIYYSIIEFFCSKGFYRLAYYMSKRCMRNYAVEFCLGAKIDSSVVFKHPIGVVIGGQAIVKKDVIIHQLVTIGAKDIDQKTKSGVISTQVIEENVVLGAGSKILGNVTIGRNSIVGANVVVTIDIPENSIVYSHNKFKRIR